MPALPDYFFINCTGDLHDTRDPNWAASPLRGKYSYHHREISTGAEVASTLRAGPYAWPGGYEIAFLADDGGTLCFDCTRKEFHNVAHSMLHGIKDGWHLAATFLVDEFEEPLFCDHCGRHMNEED